MKVKFVPQNVEFDIKPGQSVMHVAQDHNLYIKSVCKGVPSCAECRVRVIDGDHNVLPPGAEELLLIGSGHFIDRRRLSCQLKCFGDITIDMTEQIAKESGLIGGQKKKKLAIKDDRIEDATKIRSSEGETAEEGDAPRPPRGGGDRPGRIGGDARDAKQKSARPARAPQTPGTAPAAIKPGGPRAGAPVAAKENAAPRTEVKMPSLSEALDAAAAPDATAEAEGDAKSGRRRRRRGGRGGRGAEGEARGAEAPRGGTRPGGAGGSSPAPTASAPTAGPSSVPSSVPSSGPSPKGPRPQG